MVNRVNSFFPKGGRSATLTNINIICTHIAKTAPILVPITSNKDNRKRSNAFKQYV